MCPYDTSGGVLDLYEIWFSLLFLQVEISIPRLNLGLLIIRLTYNKELIN